MLDRLLSRAYRPVSLTRLIALLMVLSLAPLSTISSTPAAAATDDTAQAFTMINNIAPGWVCHP